ncbi:ATPase inhibitor subunit zeta [Mangrovicella endophytica]|uniref:ATPase inhibitor subunit zeta n=1 Tax=Mangrovicella endophytica TaxID=2066697 RepID=UPI0012FFDA3E|nr:ATPase inhibitor subunit zeta [Mangrovicella endophytica]
MHTIEEHTELSIKSYLRMEERSFYSRAHADWVVGLWAAGQLGHADEAARDYATRIVDAGVRSVGGRGGFDLIAADLRLAVEGLEGLRARYEVAMNDNIVGRA